MARLIPRLAGEVGCLTPAGALGKIDYMTNSVHQSRFIDEGYAVFSAGESPFTPGECEGLRRLLFGDASRFNLVTTGDTSEPTSVYVNRLLLDGNSPKSPDKNFADDLLGIIGTSEKLQFIHRIIGKPNLMVRRAQAHILREGGYIARHRDSESSEHYVAAVVLQFEVAKEGGDFVIGRSDGSSLTLPKFWMLITDAELPHEVTSVVRGERRTLAFWLADTSSP